MSDQFDPYRKWLGIAPKDQPPHHYRLLGIDPFEDDREVIDSAANRVMTYLKELATGDDAADSQRIMNEVMQARLCLLNPQRKAAYDDELRERLSTNQPPPPRVTPPSTKPQTTNEPSLPTPVAIVATSPIPKQHASVNWVVIAVGGGVILLAAVVLIVVAFALRDGQRGETELAEGQSDTRKAGVPEPVDEIESKQVVPAKALLSDKPLEAALSPKEPERHAPADVPSKDAPGEVGVDTKPPDDAPKAKEMTGRPEQNEQASVASQVVQEPEPVPSAEAQERARPSTLERYREEIAGSTTIAKRVDLARRMRKAATEKNREAVAKFVLLTEAHNLAVAAADVTLVNEISDQARRDFAIDRLPASESALDAAATTLVKLSSDAETPADFAAIAENAIALADQAADDGSIGTARKIASMALSAARKANDDELVRQATLRLVDLQ